MADFYSYMGMAPVVSGPDGKPIQLTGSGFEVSDMARNVALGMALAITAVPATAVTPAVVRPAAVSQEVTKYLSAADRLAFCRTHLSLNMSQMARATKRQRQTLYGWVRGSSEPDHDSELRLNSLVELARDWARYSTVPMESASNRTLSNGKSVSDMLSEDSLDLAEVRSLFPEILQIATAKGRGKERRELAEALGFETPSNDEAADQLRMNLAL